MKECLRRKIKSDMHVNYVKYDKGKLNMKNLDEIIKRFETSAFAVGAMYILPDGRLLDLSILENGHLDFFSMLDVDDPPSYLKRLGWIRLNTKIKYVELPSAPMTAIQKQKLDVALKLMGDGVQIR